MLTFPDLKIGDLFTLGGGVVYRKITETHATAFNPATGNLCRIQVNPYALVYQVLD